jgi:hypothetical protein
MDHCNSIYNIRTVKTTAQPRTNHMFRLQLCVFLVVALVGELVQKTNALQISGMPTFSSRRLFVKVATTGAVVATAAGSYPGNAQASQAEEPRKTRSKTLRGGKEMSDSTHNGTELNDKEANVAGGLLGKMGLDDITPDKGGGGRARGKGFGTSSTAAAGR